MNVADWPLYHYRAEVLSVTDGDTFRIRGDLGMRVGRETPIRIAGIDAPELRSSDLVERERGAASRLVLINILSQDEARFRSVYLRTYLDKTSFDRYIADVWIDQGDGTLIDVAQEMVTRGMAIPLGVAMMTDFPLGRREPTDGIHLTRYPLRAVMPETVATVEHYLTLPVPLRVYFNQQRESSCVGASLSQMMALLNRRRFDWRWLWNQAKAQDEWGDTNPGDNNGTSVRAGCDVLRGVGHVRVFRGHASAPNLAEGIAVNRWAEDVDAIRTCLAAGVPVVVGTPWHTKMFTPVQRPNGEWWMPTGDLGRVEGGHAYLLEAASDRRQAFRTPNSWGLAFPRTWIPYDLMTRLLEGWGEACVVTDR